MGYRIRMHDAGLWQDTKDFVLPSEKTWGVMKDVGYWMGEKALTGLSYLLYGFEIVGEGIDYVCYGFARLPRHLYQLWKWNKIFPPGKEPPPHWDP